MLCVIEIPGTRIPGTGIPGTGNLVVPGPVRRYFMNTSRKYSW